MKAINFLTTIISLTFLLPPCLSDPTTESITTRWYYCTFAQTGRCIASLFQVCGVKISGLPQTYQNNCVVCGNAGVIAYKVGPCSKHVYDCGRTTEKDCGERMERMCVFAGNVSFREEMNKTCCDFRAVGMVINGSCPKLLYLAQCRFRLPASKCQQQPKYPVCAIKKNHQAQVFDNSCFACSDNEVILYVFNLCNETGRTPHEKELASRYVMCPNQRGGPCTKNITGVVCAIPKRGLPKTLAEECTACSKNTNYVAYLNGSCESLMKKCDRERRECKSSENRVASCGFWKDGPYTNVADDLCCKESLYDMAIQGNCP